MVVLRRCDTPDPSKTRSIHQFGGASGSDNVKRPAPNGSSCESLRVFLELELLRRGGPGVPFHSGKAFAPSGADTFPAGTVSVTRIPAWSSAASPRAGALDFGPVVFPAIGASRCSTAAPPRSFTTLHVRRDRENARTSGGNSFRPCSESPADLTYRRKTPPWLAIYGQV